MDFHIVGNSVKMHHETMHPRPGFQGGFWQGGFLRKTTTRIVSSKPLLSVTQSFLVLLILVPKNFYDLPDVISLVLNLGTTEKYCLCWYINNFHFIN